MPFKYEIFPDKRLVLTQGYGTITDEEIFGYQLEVWSRPEVQGFDQLVDMTAVEHIALPSPERVRDLAMLSAKMDSPSMPSRFAIVAPQDFAFALGRMYGVHREMHPKSTTQVEVFRTRAEAFKYLGVDSLD
jgi:hypothetical protein